MVRKNIAIGVIILFVLALSLPFLDKAYHIDDTAYLFVADNIMKNPLRPYSFHLEWGSNSGPASSFMNTPLVPYYIAVVSRFFNRSEIILHLSFMIFPIMAGISFYFIAKRFIEWPLMATLTMLSTPTFLVNSHNLMLDVPMASLFLLATALFTYGVDKGNHKLLFFGSAAAGFAFLAKPHALVIVPLLLLYCFLKNRQKFMWYMLVPVIFVALFSLHNYLVDGRVFILDYIPFVIGKKESSFSVVSAFIFSNLSYIGGASIFTLFFLYPFLLKKKNFMLLSLSAIISAAISAALYHASSDFVSGKYALPQILLFFIFITSSIFFIMLVFAENYGNVKLAMRNILKPGKVNYGTGMFFVFAWLIGVYILNSGISGGAVRYNVLFMPPFLLSYFILLRNYKKQIGANMPKLTALILIFTTIIGLLVAYADYEYADSYRHFAMKVPKEYKTKNNNIWFAGSHGFQYYMQKDGYKFLFTNDNSPKKGDYVIRARLPSPRGFSNELKQRVKLVQTVTYDGSLPIRTQNTEAHAGFYTFGGGLLPYSFSNSKLEHFDIYYVGE